MKQPGIHLFDGLDEDLSQKPNVLHKSSSNIPLNTALREVIGVFVFINLG